MKPKGIIFRVCIAVVLGLWCATTAVTAQDTDLVSAMNEIAALTGEPSVLSAAGLTNHMDRLLTVENTSAFSPADTRRRVVFVGGLDGDRSSADVAVEAVRWFKTVADAKIRSEWSVSALPLANPRAQQSFLFPPDDGFYNDPVVPEARYVWRWVTYQAPDVVIELRSGSEIDVVTGSKPNRSLMDALSDSSNGNSLGVVPTMVVTMPEGAVGEVLPLVLSDVAERSPMRNQLQRRLVREPLAIARLLAERYPGTPGMAYIPAVAWVHTLRLATLVRDPALIAKVLREVDPWLSGDQPLVGERISFASLAGTMVFSELQNIDQVDGTRVQSLADQGVSLAGQEEAPGQPVYGSGWSDDIFLGTVASSLAGDADGLAAAVRLVDRYAELLQQSNGLWHHAPDAPTAWGRGNGFAALGLAELLTALPNEHPGRSNVLEIYQKQMSGLRVFQGPDGLWRQVVDMEGSYRETSVTALAVTAMARGVRLGWLDSSYAPVIERGWRGILSHVVEDGTLVDVCISTGSGTTLEHYLHRTAVNGADDRGGALILGAALEMHALASAQ